MNILKYLIYFLIASPAYGSISIVYNLRIAETSKRLEVGELSTPPSLGSATIFGTFRKKYNGVKHRATGGLVTLVYAPETFFLRVDGAVGHVTSDDHGVRCSRTQTDDLLFSGGYNPTISEKISLTFSGLFGIPTHQDTNLELIQFGYSHYGLGGQIDGSFAYTNSEDQTLRCAARLIHFFPRNAPARVDTVCKSFKYTPGNLADMFIAFYNKIARHSIEIGYNPSFFFAAKICPHLEDAVNKANYSRNNFYGVYRYNFLMGQTPNSLAVALSYGFETGHKTFGNKQIITAWTSWRINF